MRWLLLICLALNGCIVVGARNAYEIHRQDKRITALEAIHSTDIEIPLESSGILTRTEMALSYDDDTPEAPDE